jgi:hypothetical protein
MTDQLQQFTENFTTTIARFELYPIDVPTCYVVGFSVKHNTNGKLIYRDTQVSLADVSGKTDEEISNIAWVQVKDSIKSWCEIAMAVNIMPNSSYIPQSF